MHLIEYPDCKFKIVDDTDGLPSGVRVHGEATVWDTDMAISRHIDSLHREIAAAKSKADENWQHVVHWTNECRWYASREKEFKETIRKFKEEIESMKLGPVAAPKKTAAKKPAAKHSAVKKKPAVKSLVSKPDGVLM